MNALLAVEAWCAAAIEGAFARAFPGPLEPVQIARRLIATIERDPPGAADGATRYVARISAADFARLANDREFLEGQWSRMAATLSARSGTQLAAAPAVALVADPALVRGTVAVDRIRGAGTSPQRRLQLRVERGVTTASVALPAGSNDPPIVVGRDAGCDLVIADPRASRRHVTIRATNDGLRFDDLESSNGTFSRGERRSGGALRSGDRLTVGDTTLLVEEAG